MMTLELKILKATLMLRKLGNKYQTKEEQLAEFTEWYTAEREADLDEWIASMHADLILSPEELEAKRAKEFEEFLEREAEYESREQRIYRQRERDEWDDLWADRARSVGAVWC